MPEWLVEHGIGETRAVRIERGEIIEARILLEDVVPAGSLVEARLIDIGRDGRNAVAVADGQEYLLPEAPSGISQGARFQLEVTREKIPGAEPWKRPLGRVGRVDWIGNESSEPSVAMPSQDLLGEAGWDDLIEEARSGIVRFEGGEIRISPTPAMTLIDVDGSLPPEQLARHAAAQAARTILRHGIGGSIGIDFPTVKGKEARSTIAQAIDSALPQPFERTAVNGFGFLQIVRPRRHASLFELAQDRAAFEARALLRRAAFEPAGRKRLAAHPAVVTVLEARPQWIDALSRQVGGAVTLRADASIPIHGGYAEKR